MASRQRKTSLNAKKASPTVGVKFDREKPRWDLLDLKVMEEVVKVLTHGARKYADDNWKIVPNAKKRYHAALLRHIAEDQSGQVFDTGPDGDGEYVMAHVLCCAFFMLWQRMQDHPFKPEKTNGKWVFKQVKGKRND